MGNQCKGCYYEKKYNQTWTDHECEKVEVENQKQSVEGMEELRNKLVKFYWSNSLEQNGEINLDLVDGSSDFSIIPRINGRVDIEVGELRDIINYTVAHFQKLLSQQQLEVVEMVKKMLPERMSESYQQNTSLGEYMRGFNTCRDNILQSLSTLNINK